MFISIDNVNNVSDLKNIVRAGRDFLVFPAILAKVGVMNNKMYTKEFLDGTAKDWNGVKVSVSHPKIRGIETSVNKSPDIADMYVIGEVYNARFEDDKLKADIYIDKDLAIEKGYDALIERIENKESIDVSTGFRDATVQYFVGTHNNKSYDTILKTAKTDHLAILPNENGACSLKDGCGTMLVNSLELSLEQIRDKLWSMPEYSKDNIWINWVYDDYFIYSKDGKQYKQYFRIDKGEIVKVDSPISVTEKIEFVENQKINNCKCQEQKHEINNQSLNNKDKRSLMKTKTIEFISNAKLTDISDEDKASLDSLSDATLGKIQEKIIANANQIIINAEDKALLDKTKQDIAEKEQAIRGEFKAIFNSDPDGVPLATVEMLVNREKAKAEADEKAKEAQINNESKTDYSGQAGIVTNSNHSKTSIVAGIEWKNQFGGRK